LHGAATLLLCGAATLLRQWCYDIAATAMALWLNIIYLFIYFLYSKASEEKMKARKRKKNKI
jgi:predicted membrane protein